MNTQDFIAGCMLVSLIMFPVSLVADDIPLAGEKIASACNARAIVWNKTGEQTANRRCPGLSAMALAPSGKILALGNNQGQLIFSYRMDSFNGAYQNDIDLSYYPAGVYFLNVRGEAVNETVKIVKQ